MSAGEPSREADSIEDVASPEAGQTLIGHTDVFARLKKQSDNNRLPGGLLLHGPRGIGKATMAFALAREILQKTSDESDHRIAEQVASGVHPNLFVLRKKLKDSKSFYTVIRVEDVRALIHQLHQTRGRQGHRICIIDSIDDCNNSSANALLKILEEPPAETHFILISHRSGQLLPTIRSRCQAHAMRPLSDDQVREVLQTSEGLTTGIGQAVSFASGRPRRAFEALGIADNQILQDLTNWLNSPTAGPHTVIMKMAETLAAKKSGMEAGFAREILLDWIAGENHAAAVASVGDNSAKQFRLASANQLWDKANVLFADSDSYNLDVRQTWIALFDAIKNHAREIPKLALTD